MKILKIFGIVLGVHLTGLVLLFAVPGCHATSRKSQGRAPARPAEQPTSQANSGGNAPNSGAQSSPSINGGDLNPGVPPAGEAIAFPGDASGGGSRYNPTRPGTPVASALGTAPTADVVSAKRYTVAPKDTLSSIAHKHGISVKELAIANNMAANDPIRPGKALLIPAKPANPPPVSSPGNPSDTLTYKVKKNETLEQIAKRSGTTVAAIKSLNKLSGNSLKVGQELVLPAGQNSTVALAANPDVESAPKPAMGTTKYVVKEKDTLGAIATKFGVKQADLMTQNHIANPKALRVGQELTIRVPEGKAPPSNPPVEKTPPPAPENSSPVNPVSPVPESSPISAPTEPAPPVNRVEDATPVSPPRSI